MTRQEWERAEAIEKQIGELTTELYKLLSPDDQERDYVVEGWRECSRDHDAEPMDLELCLDLMDARRAVAEAFGYAHPPAWRGHGEPGPVKEPWEVRADMDENGEREG